MDPCNQIIHLVNDIGAGFLLESCFFFVAMHPGEAAGNGFCKFIILLYWTPLLFQDPHAKIHLSKVSNEFYYLISSKPDSASEDSLLKHPNELAGSRKDHFPA